MKHLVLTAALIMAPGISLAQQSAPSSNPAAHAKPATSPNQPAGSNMTEQGHVTPCGQKKSGTSDRGGGNEKKAATSGGNPNGKLNSGGC